MWRGWSRRILLYVCALLRDDDVVSLRRSRSTRSVGTSAEGRRHGVNELCSVGKVIIVVETFDARETNRNPRMESGYDKVMTLG